MTRCWTFLLGALLIGCLNLGRATAADAAPSKTYPADNLRMIRALGLDLFKALKPKQREMVNPEPVSVETDLTPSIKLEQFTEDNKTLGFVFVSVGFIDLVNNVAHAKAIDSVEKGYFDKYITRLAQETGQMELKELPNITNDKYWTEVVMNDQKSNLRQMVGTAVAIKLAHHYLGHVAKYADKRKEDAQGNRPPINTFLTPTEWEDAMRAGVRNALETGLGVEGIKALYDALDKMPKRPEWTAYFIPATAKVKPMKKEMEKIEKKFFSGEE
jgi:hypothetical protein